jgi:hypothetical protein
VIVTVTIYAFCGDTPEGKPLDAITDTIELPIDRSCGVMDISSNMIVGNNSLGGSSLNIAVSIKVDSQPDILNARNIGITLFGNVISPLPPN